MDIKIIKATPGEILKKKFSDGRTLLHACASRTVDPVAGKVYKRNETIERFARELIQFGAPVNAKDNLGYTPLHLAAARGDNFMIDLLVKNGAEVNAQTSFGDTPMYVAAFWEHAHTVRKLVRLGANGAIQNNEGLTPATMAIELEKSPEVVAATRSTVCCNDNTLCAKLVSAARRLNAVTSS